LQIDGQGLLHLTYCTNIHPAEGWKAVFANVRKFAPALKALLASDAPFGIGLRLSAREARELLEGNRLAEFRAFLDRGGLYVALINGFPYGFFHGAPVKESVYAPDWRDEARVEYTLNLGRILAALLPDGIDGGVSTAPLSYKPWRADQETAARNVIRVAEAYAQIYSDTGKFIHLDIEPEPDCLIENSDETIAFFERWPIPRDHVQVCFDCCHFAVEYEDPLVALDRFRQAGIRIGRVQLSSALRVPEPARAAERLRPFAESTYLHQTIELRDGRPHRYPDLDRALADAPSASSEWRIHFHVPLFTVRYDVFESTQDYVRTVIQAAVRDGFTRHLEIETYTWDVLPPDLKIDLLDSIRREYQWVLAQCGRQP
jgi:sugar phosphate isomerase/epimerase